MKEYKIFQRSTKLEEVEVSGNLSALSFLYSTFTGKIITRLINRSVVSALYGWLMKSFLSKPMIHNFIEQYKIDTDEISQPLESYKSLNDFFTRKLKPGARKVDSKPKHLVSPADARLLVFDLSHKYQVPVKGYWYTLTELLQDDNMAREYADGWCFVYRLAPMDYHRFCYIDSGLQDPVKTIPGVLNSVNPIALSLVDSLLAQNYRELTVMHTDNFRQVVHIEVGAMMVGKIVLNHRNSCTFNRGDEKGWFEFGGSTIIQLLKKDVVQPDDDLIAHSVRGIETLVRMGERVGCK
ncbi:MAG: phosphatidylserine decarboxylase [Bacteroidales bacterium]|nr:phosphatidylserine decarboxylase [Bacteroidales bacterium]